jgi:hypothetical protein
MNPQSFKPDWQSQYTLFFGWGILSLAIVCLWMWIQGRACPIAWWTVSKMLNHGCKIYRLALWDATSCFQCFLADSGSWQRGPSITAEHEVAQCVKPGTFLILFKERMNLPILKVDLALKLHFSKHEFAFRAMYMSRQIHKEMNASPIVGN